MSSSGSNAISKNCLTIAVIIPVYNGGSSFRACLSSIRDSQSQPDELIVVCDGGADNSGEVAKAFGAHVIELSTNRGPAYARNVGAQAATSDILFFVDADVTLHTDTIGKVQNTFQQYPDLTALIGSYDDEPGATNFLSQYKNLFHHYTHQISSEIASTFWGACGAVRHAAFAAVGGFDATCYNRVEDIELGYRLKKYGYDIRLCKEIQVKHLKRWEIGSLLKAEIFYRALPWTQLILQHRQLNADLNLSNTSRLSVVMVYLLFGSLLMSPWYGGGVVAAAALALGLVLVNRDVYRFFLRQRGLLFTVRVIPWHWFYFFYGGGAFVYASLLYHSTKLYQGLFSPFEQKRKLP